MRGMFILGASMTKGHGTLTTRKNQTLSILLIEDDLVDLKEAERLLLRSSLEIANIQHAETLADAQERLSQELYDLVLVDLNLPDSVGLDTLDTIRAAYPMTPLVVVTGEDGQEIGIEAVARGAQDYLIKGQLEPEGLRRTIRYALERQKADQTIRRERDFAERVFETTQAIVLIMDADMRIIRFNSYMRTLSGYTLEELRDSAWLDTLIAPQDHDAFRNIVTATLKQACGLGLVNTLITKDGRLRTIEWATCAFHDSQGQVVGVLATGQDITERKSAQDAIRSQVAFQKTLLAAIPCPMFYKDTEGRFLGGNKAFEKITGYPLDRIVGKTGADIWPAHCHNLNQEKDRLLLNNPGSLQYETRLECADGSVREVVVCKSTYNDVHGKVTGIIGALLDITQRSQAEAAMQEANTNLEQANRDLKEMHAQVIQSEKLASIGQLAAGVAHEMNTPVGFVASNFETLQKYTKKITEQLNAYQKLVDSLPPSDGIASMQTQGRDNKLTFILEDIQQLFEESKEGLDRVLSIVQNLRDFSRVDHSEVLQEFNINEGLRATLIVARNAVKYDADVVLELGDIPAIPCSSGQLNQVFLNIVVNAAQAIKMQERSERGRIVIRTRLENDHVLCEIEDDGPGIPPETLQKIFDPFFTTKPVGKGTGLGLSVSYDIIVNKHHGKIHATSEVGKGTCFHIALPCLPPEEIFPADEEQVNRKEAVS